MLKSRVQLMWICSRKVPLSQLKIAGTFDRECRRLMASYQTDTKGTNQEEITTSFNLKPIGYIQSCFKTKNGTPRQPSVCSFAKAKLKILKSVFVRPDHSLEGLQQFSHVWLIFIFHKNSSEVFTKAKVKPPRLNGQKTGVFACRSPYRPNPIGLTLAKLESVEGDTLHLSGIDIIDGTPVLDIKPFIPSYDSVQQSVDFDQLEKEADKHKINHADEVLKQCATESIQSSENMCSNDESHQESASSIFGSSSDSESCKSSCYCDEFDHKLEESKVENTRLPQQSDVSVGEWVSSPPVNELEVRFTPNALEEIYRFKRQDREGNLAQTKYSLEFFKDGCELEAAIKSIVSADPRSTYRRTSCEDKLYFFPLDTVHVTCWFGDGFAEILRVQPLCDANIPRKQNRII